MNILNCENDYLVEALMTLDDDFVGKVIKSTHNLLNGLKDDYSSDVKSLSYIIFKSMQDKAKKKLLISQKRKDSNSKRKNIKKAN